MDGLSNPTFGSETSAEEVVNAFSSVVSGKIIMITGVSPEGLGEAVAAALASASPGALIFTGRDISKPEAVAARIRNIHPSLSIHCIEMDLSSIQSVRAAITAMTAQIRKVDVLINNAGVMAVPERTLSKDGHEMHFATNFLGHFLLTNLLRGHFAANARIVNVTSPGYMVCPIRFHDLSWEGTGDLPPEERPDMNVAASLGIGQLLDPAAYNPMLAYLHSNAATMLFSKGITTILAADGLTAISVAPGVIMTRLQRHIGTFRNETMQYKTPSQGGASLLVAALDPALHGHGGSYVNNCQLEKIQSDHVQDPHIAKQLWSAAVAMTGLQ